MTKSRIKAHHLLPPSVSDPLLGVKHLPNYAHGRVNHSWSVGLKTSAIASSRFTVKGNEAAYCQQLLQCAVSDPQAPGRLQSFS